MDGANGKKMPQKIGLKPEQREGMEYEFTVVLDLSLDGHVATASKDRTSLFDGRHFVPGAATGQELREWLDTGNDPVEVSAELLQRLRGEAEDLENPVDLDNWGRRHANDFNRLLPDHRQELVGFCVERRQALAKAA